MKRVLSGAFGVSLTFTLLLTAVLAVACSARVYKAEFAKHGAARAVSVLPEGVDEIADGMIGYLTGKADELQITVTLPLSSRYPSPPFYSERALEHMKDVKALFGLAIIARGVMAALAAIAAVGVIALCGLRGGVRRLAGAYLLSAVGVIAALAVVAAAGYVNFDAAFVTFHHIFFSNDLWQLDWNDRLLLMMPTGFFVDMALRVGAWAVGLVGGAAVLAGLARVICKDYEG